MPNRTDADYPLMRAALRARALAKAPPPPLAHDLARQTRAARTFMPAGRRGRAPTGASEQGLDNMMVDDSAVLLSFDDATFEGAHVRVERTSAGICLHVVVENLVRKQVVEPMLAVLVARMRARGIAVVEPMVEIGDLSTLLADEP